MKERLLLILFFILFLGIMSVIMVGAIQNERSWDKFVKEEEIRTGEKALQAITNSEYEKLPPDSQQLYSAPF